MRWVPVEVLRTPRPAGQCSNVFRHELTKHLNYEGESMQSQTFLPADYSLRTQDLLPPDDFEDEDDNDVRWLEYCREASHVDRTHILDVVLSDLDADDSPLYEFIDDAVANPHEPGRPKANITDLARLGQSLLNLIAKAVDDNVNLRMAVEVPHD
jgi:hypothetical protein